MAKEANVWPEHNEFGFVQSSESACSSLLQAIQGPTCRAATFQTRTTHNQSHASIASLLQSSNSTLFSGVSAGLGRPGARTSCISSWVNAYGSYGWFSGLGRPGREIGVRRIAKWAKLRKLTYPLSTPPPRHRHAHGCQQAKQNHLRHGRTQGGLLAGSTFSTSVHGSPSPLAFASHLLGACNRRTCSTRLPSATSIRRSPFTRVRAHPMPAQACLGSKRAWRCCHSHGRPL